MTHFTTIAFIQQLAHQRKLTCAIVTTIIGSEISAGASHAEQHMSADLGGRDSHLHGEFARRADSHSMFLSVEESIEAATAALNSAAGADALDKLPHYARGGINLYSRTALGVVTGAVERRTGGGGTTFHALGALDCIVVGLGTGAAKLGRILRRNAPGAIEISTVYPSTGAYNSHRAAADKDWWEPNTNKDDIHIFQAERAYAPWDLDEHTPVGLHGRWLQPG